MKGQLILVPTPLAPDLPLEPVASERLLQECMRAETVILVEEHKEGRRRWLKWGLPREAIEKFILFNEHTAKDIQSQIIAELKVGKNVFLMSDGGLPAFYDPGKDLVRACHERGITVTATPFPNSIALSVALCGFDHESFVFRGFPPQKEPQRSQWMKDIAKEKQTQVLMDTPYRLQKILSDLQSSGVKDGRLVCLACSLGSPQEKVLWGELAHLVDASQTLGKQEFVLVVGPLS